MMRSPFEVSLKDVTIGHIPLDILDVLQFSFKNFRQVKFFAIVVLGTIAVL